MRVFHIKGFSGVLMFLLAFIGLLAVVFALPSSFVMVLWNSLVFEGFKGPEIGFGQAALLWGAMFLTLSLFMRPQISLQFRKISNSGDVDRPLRDLKKRDSED